MYVNITGSAVYSAYYYFGYWFDIREYYYYCSGYESSLDSCSQSNYRYYYCDRYYNAAGVRCVTSSMYINYNLNSLIAYNLPDSTSLDDCSPNGAVRLADGNATEGRVEYCYNGKWSAICNSFHQEELAVTCKQLGFSIYGGKMTGIDT